MTSIAAFPSVPDASASGDSIIDGVAVAAGGTVLGTRAAETLGSESAAEANAAGHASEPASFESNLNRVMESLRAGVDKPVETAREEEAAQSPFALSADKECIPYPRGRILAMAGEKTEDVTTLKAIRNRIEGGVNRSASRSAGLRGAQAAIEPEGVRRKQADAEQKSGLIGAGGANLGTDAPPSASASLMIPHELVAAGRQQNRTREGFDASLYAQRGGSSVKPRLQGQNVLPGSEQSNLFKGELASNGTEISQDESNPIAVHEQALPDRRMMTPGQDLAKTAEVESLVQAVPGAPTNAALREPGRAAASASTDSIETQNPSLYLSTPQAELKGVPVQGVIGRPARHAIHADAAADIEREKAFAGLGAQQGMDQGRMREAAAAIGQVEQRAYNFSEAARPSTSASNGPARSDPFSVLDADQAAGSMTWIHAGAHRAEAGYLDPALGWVSVRAEAASGEIHAAVMSGSAEAAQVLGGHMTGLSSHLAQQHLDTATVTLASAQDGRDGWGWGSQAGGGDRGTERHSAGGNETRQTVLTGVSGRRVHTGSGATTTNMLVQERPGSTISVMA
jgi:hypothetical protein